jgi:peptidyl-prolyl cis-trans isomerase SurA
MEQPEQIRLSEILVSTQKAAPPQAKVPDSAKPPDAANPAESAATPAPQAPAAPSEADLVAQADAKAKSLREQIAKGAAFEDVAKKNSDGPSAAQGGDLGYFERGKLSKELEDMTFAMKAGDVSEPIRTKQGFVILKVTEHQKAGIPTLKQIEPRIQDALYYQKLTPALRTYLTKLREDAFIDIRPGYIDSGASPNQTKPVETATKEASAKNLKKKKKFGVF